MSTYTEIVKRRRSIRKYKENLLLPEQLEQILKTGLMAPSSKRSLSWEFIVVENKNTLLQMSECKAQGGSFLAKAPIAIVVLGNETKSDVWIEDASIAAIMMQLQAEDLGLGSCWIQMRNRFDNEGNSAEDNLRELLHFPAEWHPLCILALGLKDEEKAPFNEEKIKWEKVHIEEIKPETQE